MFFSTRSPIRHRTFPRSLADILRHGPARSSNALRAEATAWSTSLAFASETWVSTSPVAGFTESNDLPEPSTHWPLMSSLPGATFALVAVSICELLAASCWPLACGLQHRRLQDQT